MNGSREMIGIGAANIGAGLFQGFPVSTSGSRTAVAEQAGAKTQVTGLVGALVIGLMLLFLPGLFQDLPSATLAAVVISAALSLADIASVRRLWEQRRVEFWLSIAAFLAVALLGVLPGIGIAVALSIVNVFRRSWWPYMTILGRVPGMQGLHDVRSYPDAERLPGCVVFRFDAPLFFANARTFREQLRAIAAGNVEQGGDARGIVQRAIVEAVAIDRPAEAQPVQVGAQQDMLIPEAPVASKTSATRT